MSTIRWSPYSAIARDLGSTTVVFGTLGKGKSYFIRTIAENEIAMGRRVIAIDGKDDVAKIKTIHPNVEVIDVNNIQEGALNPFTFLDEIDSTTLYTIIELLVGKLDDKKSTAIIPIIQDFILKYRKKMEYTDMLDVANYLMGNKDENARSVGNALKLFEDKRMGKLLFTRKQDLAPLYISDSESVVISLLGLDLPTQGTKIENYTAEERFTSTIVYLITSKLRSILINKKKVPTTIFFDEAHLLFGNQEMAKVIDTIMSTGRSLLTASVLITQGVGGLPDISKYVTSKFMFGNSLSEAEAFLDKYNPMKYVDVGALDVPSVATAITKLNKGECFFIDSFGRSGFIKIITTYDKSN